MRDIFNQNIIFLDGAMGTMLQSKGMQVGELPELFGLKNPGIVTEIHKSYIEAGANIIYTNTFGANRYKIERTHHSVEEIINAAVQSAKEAVKGTDTLIALSIGSIGKLMEPAGNFTFEEAYETFKEMVTAGREADLIAFETFSDLYELKAAILAAKENSDLPVLCTMTFEASGRTFTGCLPAAFAMTAEGLGVDAIGVNCGLGPYELKNVITEIREWTSLPLVFKPNAGLPNPDTNKFELMPAQYAEAVFALRSIGITAYGGCCGTTPEHIRKLTETFKANSVLSSKVSQTEHITKCGLCSATCVVSTEYPRAIGERINPTGKKQFKEALLNADMDYIVDRAAEQTDAGAELLDVNVGLPGIDETDMMTRAVKRIQSAVDAPLQLDSTNPSVLNAALRIYNGKPIVNSVNGETEVLESILPLVKKYGAAVVGLTLDKKGIPERAEERFAIAEKIVNKAQEYGIKKENVFIDCLTLTVSAEQEGALETLKALKMVKERLGVKTVLGVSNISFGLPGRETVNQAFLTMALMAGLDFPIMNPNVPSMMGALCAFRLLNNTDKNAEQFIEYCSRRDTLPVQVVSQAQPVCKKSNEITDVLESAVRKGKKAEVERITEELLASNSPMTVINERLIPILDRAGVEFESGRLYLPQLILTAESTQAAFAVINQKMKNDNGAVVSNGTIILATVKGDIHDIGKNIVKVLLENYGYTVIDLGKDVEPQRVVDAVAEHGAGLVGLSALMTTTLKSMEDTISLLHETGAKCKIMVGGAVLTPEYAQKIKADFYCKDAKESVDTARLVFDTASSI